MWTPCIDMNLHYKILAEERINRFFNDSYVKLCFNLRKIGLTKIFWERIVFVSRGTTRYINCLFIFCFYVLSLCDVS